MQKLLTFFSKNISLYAIFNYQSFNDTLTNDIVKCFEQLGPGSHKSCLPWSNGEIRRTLVTTTAFVPKDVAIKMNLLL